MIHISKFKQDTDEKYSSTISPPTAVKPIRVCHVVYTALADHKVKVAGKSKCDYVQLGC